MYQAVLIVAAVLPGELEGPKIHTATTPCSAPGKLLDMSLQIVQYPEIQGSIISNRLTLAYAGNRWSRQHSRTLAMVGPTSTEMN